MSKRVLLLLALTSFLNAASSNAQGACANEIRIASGREDGLYYAFVEAWNDSLKASDSSLCLVNQATGGSVSNLALIDNDDVEFAIIQGDIGHHSYYGKNGYSRRDRFLGVRPLFREYVQILVRGDQQNPIVSISDLQGKVIASGGQGSGGYWNAIDVLKAANLHEGFDYQLYEGDEHPVDSLLNNRADAAFYTSARPHKLVRQAPQGKVKHIPLSLSSSKHLSVALKKSYYDHGTLQYAKTGSELEIASLGVQAYLIVNEAVEPDLVVALHNSLDTFFNSTQYQSIALSGLDLISEVSVDPPFEMHSAVGWMGWNSVLAKVVDTLSRAWFFLLVTVLATVVIVFRFFWTRKYNAAGLIKGRTLLAKVIYGISVFSRYAIGLALWFATLIVVSRVIVWQEDKYAALRGVDSPLEGFGVIEGTIWLVKTAFTTLPGEVPFSAISSILIPATVLLGVGAFLHPVHVGFSAYEKRRMNKLSGGGDYANLTGHVLICGWNERAPGIIYSLISKYAPEPKTIVVIANIQGDSPLLQHGIDSKYVHFVRGNAVDTNVLRRAGAANAKEAVIVACESMRLSMNKGSIPIAVALRSMANVKRTVQSQDLFICAELINSDNRDSFVKAGVNSFVNVDDVTNKVIAASTVSSGVSDFIIDLLSFDDYYEIYTQPISKISENVLQSARSTNGTYHPTGLRQALSENGIQLFGRLRDTHNGEYKFAHCNSLHGDAVFEESDSMVFFSVVKSKLDSLSGVRANLETSELENLKPDPAARNALIVGSDNRGSQISELLTSLNIKSTTIECELFVERMNNDDESLFREWLQQFSNFLILEEGQRQASDDMAEFLLPLLITQYLNGLRCSFDSQVCITVELQSHEDRELYLLAGADDVSISNTLVERLLAKMVFNHGLMYEVIDHVTTLDNGNFLQSYTVKEGDIFSSLNVIELFKGYNANFQVIGWKPKRLKRYLQKDTMGITSHWITAFDGRKIKKELKAHPRISAGDELMLFNTSGRPFEA